MPSVTIILITNDHLNEDHLNKMPPCPVDEQSSPIPGNSGSEITVCHPTMSSMSFNVDHSQT